MTQYDYARAIAEATVVACLFCPDGTDPDLDAIIASVEPPPAQHHDAPTCPGWWWARRNGEWEAVNVKRWGAKSVERHVAKTERAGTYTGDCFDRWVGPLSPPDTTTPAPDVQASGATPTPDIDAAYQHAAKAKASDARREGRMQLDELIEYVRNALRSAERCGDHGGATAYLRVLQRIDTLARSGAKGRLLGGEPEHAGECVDRAPAAQHYDALRAAVVEWNEARGSLSVARSVHDGDREIIEGYARLHAAEVALMQAIEPPDGGEL